MGLPTWGGFLFGSAFVAVGTAIMSCTPKTGPGVKLDFSGSAKNEKEQTYESKTKTT
jgi:hypothetical protein